MFRILLCIQFILFIGQSFAQQLTLDSAIAIAMHNSPGLMIAKNNVAIAGISNSYGMAGGLPLIQGTSNASQQMTSLEQKFSNPLNNKSSTNAPANNIGAGLAASMPIFEGGKIQNEKQRLNVVESQTKKQYTSRAQTVIYN